MKTKKLILLVTLMVLLVGVASASEVSEDNVNTIDTTSVDEIVQDTPTITDNTDNNVTEKQIDNKIIQKEEKNIKTASKTYDVNDFNTLNSVLTNSKYTTVTINIKSNIILTDNTILNEKISKLTINGNGKTIDGQNNYQFLKINNNSVTLKNLKIINCKADDGGAIYNEFGGELTIYNSTFNNNTATFGGAIYNDGTLTVTDTQFTDNQALGEYGSGGAIYNFYYGNLTVTGTHFADNQALGEYGRGGAIYNGDILTVTETRFTDNHASYGGAIYNFGGILTVTETGFTGNKADKDGGAINNYGGTLTVTNTEFTDNHASYGGAIYNYYWGTLTVTGTQFTSNNATGGGAIYNDLDSNLTVTDTQFTSNNATGGGAIDNGGTLTVNNTQFTDNHADNDGGAIYNGGTLTVTETRFTDNHATIGGAIYNKGTLTVTKTQFTDNHATSGGAIFNGYILTVTSILARYPLIIFPPSNECILTVTNTEFTDNHADNDGGAIDNGGSLTVTKTQFTDNHATSGGAIYNYGSTLTMTDTQFTTNNATSGGAIYNKGTLTVTDTQFTSNNADNDGGAIFTTNPSNLTPMLFTADPSNLTISNSILEYNNATTGSAIYNDDSDAFIQENYFIANTAQMTGNAIINEETATIEKNKGDKTTKYNGTIYTNSNRQVTIINNKFLDRLNTYINITTNNNKPTVHDKIKVTFTLKDQLNRTIAGENIIITLNDNTSNKNYTVKTNTNGTIAQEYTPTASGTQTITATYNGNSQYNNSTATTKITVKNKFNTKTTVYTAKGVIGNTLTLKATLTDSNNKKVTNGYVIFKLNGITIKDNKKLTGSKGNLKVYVKDGVATVNLTADLNMRHAKNLTAVYAGSSTYNASRSNTATAEIALRNASITVTTNTKVTKQGQNITLKATVKDVLRKNSNLEKYEDQYVFFKINGITLKDKDGKTLQAKIVNGIATTVYTVPLALSGVTDCKTMTPRNHTVTAGFVNPNYYPNARANSTFQVERSNITINFENVTINNKTHKMAIKASIKDYLGNYVKGPNKYIIKVNGATLKNATKTLYFQANNGIINIENIVVPAQQKYTSIEIVTQDRLGYKNQRNTTTKISVIK